MDNMINEALEKLSAPATDKIIGRGSMLDYLNYVLNNDSIAVLGIKGSGGIGKTALIHAWLKELKLKEYEIDYVYAWHFHDKEKGKESISSSTPFFDYLFKRPLFLEQGSSTNEFFSEERKAKLLFDKLSEKRMILVLDAFEVLQKHDGKVNGRFADRGYG